MSMNTAKFNQWYQSLNKPFLPPIERIISYAELLYKQSGEKREVEEIEYDVWNWLEQNMDKFNPSLGNIPSEPQERFLLYFAKGFKLKIIRDLGNEQLRIKRERDRLSQYRLRRLTCEPYSKDKEDYWDEKRRLVREELERLPELTRLYITHKHLDKWTDRKIAQELGMSVDTLSRRYKHQFNFEETVKMIKNNVRTTIDGLDNNKLYAVMFNLTYQLQLTDRQIGSLLMMTTDEVHYLQNRTISKIESSMARERKGRGVKKIA